MYINQKRTENKIRQIINCFLLIHKHLWFNILKQYPNCFLHVDCTQGIGKVKLDLQDVDLISFALHKFYGLNGFGGLIKRQDIVLEPSRLVKEEEINKFLKIFNKCYNQ